jgi:hypothetical protein
MIRRLCATAGQAGRLAGAVQPRGGFQQIGAGAENRCQASCPRGDALDVCPAAGKGRLQECPGELFSPGSQRVHAAKARQPARGVNRRGMPSEDVEPAAAGRCWPGHRSRTIPS